MLTRGFWTVLMSALFALVVAQLCACTSVSTPGKSDVVDEDTGIQSPAGFATVDTVSDDDGGGDDGPESVGKACKTNSDCSDEEVGQCQKSTCHPDNGTCQADPVVDFTPCDDGDSCTSGDVCLAGVCEPGAAANCDDGNPCTDDGCSGADGCINIPNNECAWAGRRTAMTATRAPRTSAIPSRAV